MEIDHIKYEAADQKIEVVAEPRRNISSFVKGYTEMKVICRG